MTDFYRGRTKLESKARLLIGLTLVLLLGAIFIIIERTHSELLFQRIRERSALTARELLLFIETSGVDVNNLTDTRSRLNAYLKRLHPSPAYTVRLISGRSAEGKFLPENENEASIVRRVISGEAPWVKRTIYKVGIPVYRYYVPLVGASGEPPSSALSISFPIRNELRTLWHFRLTLAVAGVFAVTFALIVLYFLIRVIVIEPVEQLRDVSERIRSGDLNARAGIRTGDEIEEFADAFNNMVTHLQSLTNDLDARVKELGQANLHLYEMNRLRSEFLAVMSHELRTPLNSIIGFSEILQEQFSGKINKKQEEFLAHIHSSGKQLLKLINDILDLARIEAGKVELHFEKVTVRQILRTVFSSIPLEARNGIRTKIRLERNLPPLITDASRLTQILFNLLSNAYKFTPKGGLVRLTAQALNGRMQFTVSDSGPGIPEEEQRYIFEKFRQADSSRTRTFGGTGLGLSIVKELCLLLGGDVSVQSEPEKGSTFKVVLPISPGKPPSLDRK